MKIKWHILFAIVCLWLVVSAPVLAQTPRPTPTNVASSPNENDSNVSRGSIFGNVYLDVNGDGSCVNSGVEGEQPLANVNLQFTSSDGGTTIPLTTGGDGTFGLVSAGESNWEVMAIPEANMVVTSQNPIYVPVYKDGTLDHSNINFCIASTTSQTANPVAAGSANAIIVTNKGSTTITESNALILSPDSGAPAKHPPTDTVWFIGIATLGTAFFLMGFGMEKQRRKTN